MVFVPKPDHSIVTTQTWRNVTFFSCRNFDLIGMKCANIITLIKTKCFFKKKVWWKGVFFALRDKRDENVSCALLFRTNTLLLRKNTSSESIYKRKITKASWLAFSQRTTDVADQDCMSMLNAILLVLASVSS